MIDAATSVRQGPPSADRVRGLSAKLARARTLSQPHASVASIALAGVSLASVAAYLAASPPRLSGHSTTLVWVAVGVSAATLGLYAAGRSSARPARVLAPAVILWIVWLMLVSGDPTAFTLGWLLIGLTVPLVGYEMLASFKGSELMVRERALLLASSAVAAISWSYLALTSREPTLLAPLVRCVPACPRNVLFVGMPPHTLAKVAADGLRVAWLAAAFGVVWCIAKRYRTSGAAARRCVAPTLVVSGVYAGAVAACLAVQLMGLEARMPVVLLTAIAATVLPLAMIAGLVWERLFMGGALEEFVNRMAETEPRDLPALMARVLHDPTVQIGYSRPAAIGYVDPAGASVELPDADLDQAVTSVDLEMLQEAVVIHRGAVPDEERFIRAAGMAALMSYENHRLEADLSAVVVELAASRKRIVEAANAERQRIERDLHDGIQQRMVGARVRLELAEEALESNPPRGRQMLGEIGCDIDDALEEVRALAQGVYPAVLVSHGLIEALRSAARRSPGPVSVRGDVGRYPADTEAAIYFCCLETLQNVAKHAGRDATVTLRIWEDALMLRFQTRDSGVGFAPNGTRGRGLVNMRDRLAAVGGSLTLRSRIGVGTVVTGCVPLAG